MRTTLLLAVLLCAPLAASAAPGRSASHEALRTQCLLHAADPKNPWALAHGIVGLGPKFAAADGRRASHVLVGDFLKKGDLKEAGPYGFQRTAQDGTPIEPHTNLIMKTLVLSGLPDTTRFTTPFGEVSLGDLVRSVQRSYRHVPENEQYWQDVGWTLDLLAHRLTPKNATFRNGADEEVDFTDVMNDALAYLELSQRELAEGLAQHKPEVPKRKQGIYAHSCGGLHLFQAVAHWARYPEIRKAWGERFQKQVDVLFYRLGSEQRQYDAALQAYPQYRLQILTQMVKFYGHFLETTGRMKKDGVLRPNAAQKREIARAQALLDQAVRGLQEMGAFDRMDELAKSQPQIHLDLTGDACHAAHGLELWR